MRVIVNLHTSGQHHAPSLLPAEIARADVDSFEEGGSLPLPVDQLSRCIDCTSPGSLKCRDLQNLKTVYNNNTWEFEFL